MRQIPIVLACIISATPVAAASEVPDAFSVEWQGQHPCEKLYEDARIRVGRCTFPPGAVHLCHSHPADVVYTLSGGTGQVRDARGTRKGESKIGEISSNAPIPWHEYTNIGDTTISYLIIEKKYEPAPDAGADACK